MPEFIYINSTPDLCGPLPSLHIWQQVQQALNRANWPSVLMDADAALEAYPTSKIKPEGSQHCKHDARQADGEGRGAVG